MIRIASDIGGTFTDVVLDRDGALTTAKVLTTPAAPERGLLDALERVLAQAAVAPGEVDQLIHGTTLATNALIERKGARTAQIATAGFRDVLEMAHENRFDQYDLSMDRAPPLIARSLRLEVDERMAADGGVLRPLRLADVDALVETLEHLGIESLAITLLHAYANPAHEQALGRAIAARLPHLAISLSSEVSPEIREYERFSTTCANAYIQPLMARYLAALSTALEERGFACPLLLVTSSGDLTDLPLAMAFPVRLVESGPAGGAVLAASLARAAGLDQVLAFDMGGTTAKLCLIDAGKPRPTRGFEVARAHNNMKGSGFPLRIPAIDLVEIGSGGGSIAGLDSLGRLLVGPRSAASVPGPICYGRGGTEPTVTDADVVLGKIDPTRFSGGIALDVARARTAIGERIGAGLALDGDLAAFAVNEIVDENMAAAARVHAIESGLALEGRTLIAFGGAAPLHAARVARKIGVSRVMIPANAGVGSAIGFLDAGLAFEQARSLYMPLGAFDPQRVNLLLEEAADAARRLLSGEGAVFVETRMASMRYRGQGHEITVTVPDGALTAASAGDLQAAFDQAYVNLFGQTIPALDLEILTWTVRVGRVDRQTPRPLPRASQPPQAAARRTQAVFDPPTQARLDYQVLPRESLQPGFAASGPCLVTEPHTTTVVPSDAAIEVAADGALVLNLPLVAAEETARTTGMNVAIGRQIAWNRLIAVVEEQAQTLIRIAFSTTVREAGDLSAGVFDPQGRMLAQAVTGTPGHVNAMAAAVGHVLAAHPLTDMAPGDVFVTNDPWRGTGHLNDFTVVTPVHRDSQPLALVASTSHMVDVGGLGFGADGGDVHEEGIFIPIMPFVRAGEMDATLLRLIRANVRFPMEVEGDLRALIACNAVCARRIVDLTAELGMSDLDALGAFILEASERGMRAAIDELPQGRFTHAMTIDGLDAPIHLRASLEIGPGRIVIDFAGTSPAVARGINVPLIYTEAMASFGVRAIIGGRIPNNAGSLAPVTVIAPRGSILNAAYPAPVSARHVVGQMVPDVVLGCLAQAVPDRVPAEGASALWILALSGGTPGGEGDSRPFSVNCFHNGGTGARPGKDGLSATAFPSGVRSGSVEVTESAAPLVFWRKAFRPGSGGAGEFRGGLGQIIEVGHRADEAFAVSCLFDRVDHPARGRFGGGPGALGSVRLASGQPLAAKGRQGVPAGQTVIFKTPGGGGLGDPDARAAELRESDRVAGLVGT